MRSHPKHSTGSSARKAATLALTALLTAAALGSWPAASAESVDRRLSKARSQDQQARETVGTAERRLATALRELRAIQQQLSQAAVDVVASYQAQEDLTAELEAAQEALDRRATEAYQAGPAIELEMFLGSATPADFASAQEFAARAFTIDQETVAEVTRIRSALAELTVRREARQQELASSADRLEELVTEAADELRAAREEARKAGMTVRTLEREAQALRQARAAADASLAGLVDSSRGKDQSELLALLGPTGGRTCHIPPGLRDTNRDLAGYSSWYGWEFAGRPTASGAIFDPRLFTLANKELPLGVFLRIKYKGKCAIALVNDRGPYGVPGRIFDVSEAVAKYLGYKGSGVAYVTTDVLVPA